MVTTAMQKKRLRVLIIPVMVVICILLAMNYWYPARRGCLELTGVTILPLLIGKQVSLESSSGTGMKSFQIWNAMVVLEAEEIRVRDRIGKVYRQVVLKPRDQFMLECIFSRNSGPNSTIKFSPNPVNREGKIQLRHRPYPDEKEFSIDFWSQSQADINCQVLYPPGTKAVILVKDCSVVATRTASQDSWHIPYGNPQELELISAASSSLVQVQSAAAEKPFFSARYELGSQRSRRLVADSYAKYLAPQPDAPIKVSQWAEFLSGKISEKRRKVSLEVRGGRFNPDQWPEGQCIRNCGANRRCL